MFRNILSFTVPFVLLNLMAPEGAGGGGGSSSQPQSPPEPEANATIEQKLDHWKRSALDFFKQLGGAMKERDDAQTAKGTAETNLQNEQTAHGQTKTALQTEKDAHTATKNDLSSARTTITGLTTERDTARKNVTRLEKLCDLRGVDHKEVVPAEGEGAITAPAGSVEALQQQYAQEKDPQKKAELAAKIVKAREKKDQERE